MQADQSCDHNRQEKWPANAFDDCKAPSYICTRRDVAITERRQCDEAEVDCARLGEFAGEDKGARFDLFENPIQETEASASEQISAEGGTQMFGVDLCGIHGEAQGSNRCKEPDQGPNSNRQRP